MTDQSPFYDEYVWIDDDPPDIDGTEFTAERMNHIEVGVGSAHARIDGIELTPGPPGDPGTPGADGADGQGFNFRGVWDPEGEYLPYDVTTYGGETWVCIAYTAFGVEPPGAPTEWTLAAASGAVGPQGPAGASGAVGAQGPAGVGSGAVGGVLSGFLPNPGLASGVASGALSGYFVGVSDPRLSDARPPSGAAGGVLSGAYPNPGLASAVASGALAQYFIGVGQPAQGSVGGPVLSGSLPNPGLASASFASAFASGVDRRIYVEAGLGTGSANVGNSVRLSFGSGAIAEIYALAASGVATFQPVSGADDVFLADSSANYTARLLALSDWQWDTSGTGVLKPIGTGTKRRLLTWNLMGQNIDQGLDIQNASVNASDGQCDWMWLLKYIDANNYLYLEFQAQGDGHVYLWEVRNGSTTRIVDLFGGGFPNIWPGNGSYWTRARIQGNVVSFVSWNQTSDVPDVSTPAYSASYTLTGATATAFGDGVAGYCGFGIRTTAATAVVKQFVDRVKGYVANAPSNQLRVRVKRVNGTYYDRLLLDGLGRSDLAGVLGL